MLRQYVRKISLKTNMRVQLQHDESAEVFAKQLLDIGNGEMEMDAYTHCITFPENFCQIVESGEVLIANVFFRIYRRILKTINGLVNVLYWQPKALM